MFWEFQKKEKEEEEYKDNGLHSKEIIFDYEESPKILLYIDDTEHSSPSS
jgi:hypothetical protein